MQFSTKIILITGASSGIGKTTALLLAKTRATLILLGRNKERLAEVLRLVKIYSPASDSYHCDITNPQRIYDVIKDVLRKHKKIDILINNAGYGMYRGFNESSEEDLQNLMDTNYFGTVHITKAVLPSMLKQGNGHIVNIASVAGKAGFPGNTGYCASKFAVVGLTEALYYELKDKNIHVHLICPGAVNTPFQQHSPGYEDFDHYKRHTYIIQAEDVAQAIKTAIEKNIFETILPKEAALKLWGKGLLPKLWRKTLYKITRGEKY
ncbi:MAG: SDR family oxidoreductase [Nanoarchaeota archaeon]|nr:SDR family oxidoreductase [Nanoarchaeota archaeon]